MIHALLLVVKSFEIQCLRFQEKQLYPFPQIYYGIYIYVLSWVRTYLIDDYIFQFLLSSVVCTKIESETDALLQM